jgi:hypothetical protein
MIVNRLKDWIIRGTNPDAESSPDGRSWEMRFCSRCTKVLVFCALVPILFAVLGFVLVVANLDRRTGFAVLGMSGLLFLGCLYSVIDSYRRIVTFDDDGLTIHRSFRGPLRIEWEDIQSVVFSEAFWELKIRRVAGSSGYIGVGMNGLGTLAQYLDWIAPGTIAPDARRFLPVY